MPSSSESWFKVRNRSSACANIEHHILEPTGVFRHTCWYCNVVQMDDGQTPKDHVYEMRTAIEKISINVDPSYGTVRGPGKM